MSTSPKQLWLASYEGTITIRVGGTITHQIPVELTVRDFTLPDMPSAKTMVYLGYEDVSRRYVGEDEPEPGSPDADTSRLVRNRHFAMAHRHKISLIGSRDAEDQPEPEWTDRLSGSLFTTANGYDGPGVNVGNNVYSIGTYGDWSWQGEERLSMHAHTNAWVDWFDLNAPTTEYFLYLADEPDDEEGLAEVERWAEWINSNPGSGSRLMSFATIAMPSAIVNTPSLDIAASWSTVGVTSEWQEAVDSYEAGLDRRAYLYNGVRPGSGSFAIEDDGVALRELPWGQMKKGIDRWFFWQSVYYDNFQGEEGETNVFQRAQTFGTFSETDPVLGETGFNYSNGDGVLFYPGTDRVFPLESYGVKGPFSSLRLKHWRRGIQDVDYVILAAAIDPDRVAQIVKATVPTVLWDYGVEEPSDPTYVLTDISWSTDPDDWERTRAELADIIESQSAGATATPPLTPTVGDPTGTPTPPIACAGDCNGDGRVLINEVIIGVNVGIGLLAIESCEAADGNDDGRVLINEVIAAVNNGLQGCP